MIQRLPKCVRLRAEEEIRRISRRGKRRRGKWMTLVALANRGCGMPDTALPGLRFAVVTSRKVGPAVLRNRFKRLVREVFRRRLIPGGVPGWDFLVIIHHGADSQKMPTYSDIEGDLVKLMRLLIDPVNTKHGKTS